MYLYLRFALGQFHRYVRYFLTRVPVFKLTGSKPQTLFLLHFGIKCKGRYSCFQNSIHLAILSSNFPRTFNNVVVMYVTQYGHGFLALKRKSLYLLNKVPYKNQILLNLLSDDLVFL